MLIPFKYGLGVQLGNGEQWMSWIHRYDVISAIDFLLHHENMHGPFNLTAPHPVKNSDFTYILANAMHRPSFLKLPAFCVKLIFGEMGESLLLQGKKILPDRLLDAGYLFKFKTLEPALKSILS